VWWDLLWEDGDCGAEDEDGGEMAVGEETPGGGHGGGQEIKGGVFWRLLLDQEGTRVTSGTRFLRESIIISPVGGCLVINSLSHTQLFLYTYA